jgi:hypothetical protein
VNGISKGKFQISNFKLLFLVFQFAICHLKFEMPLAWADQVIMKDGTVYKGKILIDTDKAILIGNPPFDPNSYLLKSEDIEKIIYEEYRLNPPAERKRGLLLETRLGGNVFGSSEMPLGPAASLYAGAGFRVHPLFEIDGGMEYLPSLHATGGLSVSDGTTTRGYESFYQYTGIVSGRFYPFWTKKWKAEPYAVAGYGWSRMIPKGSGDSLRGAGWHAGFGVLRPLSTHLFLEGRFVYQSLSFDTIQFLGREGSIQPEIDQHDYAFSVGISYRI